MPGCFILPADRILRQRNVGRDLVSLQTGQELTIFVGSIGTKSLGPYLVMTIRPFQHHARAAALGVSVCLIHGNVQAQAVTILHQHVGTVIGPPDR